MSKDNEKESGVELDPFTENTLARLGQSGGLGLFNFGVLDSLFEGLDQIMSAMGGLFSTNEDGSLNASVDIPGIREEDLKVHIDTDLREVVVVGETKTSCYSRHVEESFIVPVGYSMQSSSRLENGVLVLTFPKEATSAPELPENEQA